MSYHSRNQYCVLVIRSSDSSRNAYIEETVLCAINGVAGLEPEIVVASFQRFAQSHKSFKVTLQADNDFYSQVTRVRLYGAVSVAT